MNTPATDIHRFLLGCLIGACLGVWYGALRPMRQKHPYLADLLFVPALFYGWLYLSFAICGGDLRIGYTVGLLIGCLLEELTLGKLLRPVFSFLWKLQCRIYSIFTLPIKKFFKFCGKTVNFLFARSKKWSTIK